MLAVWGLQTQVHIGGPKKFNIVELGPGRGTLSKDILRVSALSFLNGAVRAYCMRCDLW
jgi:SAM-dependent MidA family methyltransferase